MPSDKLAAVRGILKRFTTPLLPDDYSALINPLWSTRELRGKIVRVQRDLEVVHLDIIPGWGVPTDFHAGQYIGIGVLVDGRYTWRSYSLTNAPGHGHGTLSITVRAVEKGKLSNHLVDNVVPGTTIRLLAPAGEFHLTDPLPPAIAFVTAGTGLTPVISMLRTMDERGQFEDTDVVLVHSARTQDDVLFASELRRLADAHPRLHVHTQITGEQGRISPAQLPELIPGIGDRVVYACGPAGMLDELEDWAEENRVELKTERFTLERESDAQGGTITFPGRATVEVDGATTILEAGEKAGVNLPFGCRMGVCHTCVRPLVEGHAHNLVTGEVHEPGSRVRTCVSVAAGDLTIEP